MDVTQENLRDLFFQYKASFSSGLQEKAPIDIGTICETVPSSSERNLYPFLHNIPGFRKWAGTRLHHQFENSKYELQNETFEDGFTLMREQVQDDQYGIYNPTSRFLGRAASFWPYEQVFLALQEGTTRLCYDQNPFFDTEHPNGRDGDIELISNDDGGSDVEPWYLMDVNQIVKPLMWQLREAPVFESLTEGSQNAYMDRQYLYGSHARGAAGYGFWQFAYRCAKTPTETKLRELRLKMAQIKTPEGRRMGVRGSLIVCGASNVDAFEKVLKRTNIAEGGVSVSNVLSGFSVLDVPILD